jgi:hypothetical protein
MSPSRIVGVAATSVAFSLVIVNATSHSFRAKAPTKLPFPANSLPILTAAASVTPCAKPPQSILPERTQPTKSRDSADMSKPSNTGLVDHVMRELSEHCVEKQLESGDGDHRSLAAPAPAQFDGFATRFAAAVDNVVQNSKLSADEANGTRKLNVRLISDEVTNAADNHAVSGLVRLDQTCDFQSNDGQVSWTREWAFEFCFVMQGKHWHCVGGKCRVVKDENSSYMVKSRHIGEVFNLPEGTWDDLDIR